MSVYSRDTFIKNYTKAIVAKEDASLEKTVKKIAAYLKGLVPSVSFDAYGNTSFSLAKIEGADEEKTLQEVLELPEQLATKDKRWIVAFDEFQEITTLHGESFEKLLRSVIQHHQKVLKALSEMPDAVFLKETASKYDLGQTSSTQKALESSSNQITKIF